jgi:hypothetical protein
VFVGWLFLGETNPDFLRRCRALSGREHVQGTAGRCLPVRPGGLMGCAALPGRHMGGARAAGASLEGRARRESSAPPACPALLHARRPSDGDTDPC